MCPDSLTDVVDISNSCLRHMSEDITQSEGITGDC